MKKMNYDKKKLKMLKNTYMITKASYEEIKEESEEIQASILANHEFYEDDEWTERKVSRGGDGERKRILTPNNSFLMDDKDFQIFLDLCYEEYKRAGIADDRGREYCPEAKFYDWFKEAETKLVMYAIDIIPDGMTEKNTLRKAVEIPKYKDRVLDLILKLEC